jgi:ADP-heptose:LPS heptosyltransferase
MATPASAPAERFLLFCTTGLGDSLFATPAIRFLRQRCPSAQIDVVVKWDIRNVFATNPHLDRLVHYRNNALWKWLARWQTRRRAPYRAAFFFHVGDEVTELIRGVPHERLYCVQALRHLPAHARCCAIDAAHHRQWEDFAAMVAREVGGNADDFEFELPLAPESRRAATAYFADLPDTSGPRVGIQLGGSHLGKCWPPDRYAALATRIVSRYGGRVFVNAIPREQMLVDGFIARLAKETERRCHQLPQTTINGLAGLLRELDLFISNDTGPLHVALSQDRPVIALKAHDDFTYPYTLPRETPLRRSLFVRSDVPTSGQEYQKSHRAMECITLDAVWSEVQSVLQKLNFLPQPS